MTVPSLARWVCYHAVELTCVMGPLALAATVAPWCAVLALPVGIWWLYHEIRLWRRRHAARQHLASATSQQTQLDEVNP